MMQKFSLEIPLNSTSLGQMGAGILAELYKRDQIFNLFPIGQIDLSNFKAPDQGFIDWLNMCIKRAIPKYSRDEPSIKYFHIGQSVSAIGKYSRLYTVHETNQLTDYEVNILNQHDSVLVPSKYNQEVFAKHGIQAGIAKNFFDSRHIYKIDRRDRDYVTWSLIGKLEKRKNTIKIIDLWDKKFGGNRDHRLNLSVFNQFAFQNYPVADRLQIHKQFIQQQIGRELSWNINFVNRENPDPKKGETFFLNPDEMNQVYNEVDIDLSGLSGAEGTNLPYLNTRCLGRKGICLNAHAHLDYANKENSILVESSGLEEIYDGLFFQKGQALNQGFMFSFNDDEVTAAFDKVLAADFPSEQNSKNLKEEYSVKNCVDSLLGGI